MLTIPGHVEIYTIGGDAIADTNEDSLSALPELTNGQLHA